MLKHTHAELLQEKDLGSLRKQWMVFCVLTLLDFPFDSAFLVSLILVCVNIDNYCTLLICITDAEFAVSVDANNPELRKQYSEIKALLMEVSSYLLQFSSDVLPLVFASKLFGQIFYSLLMYPHSILDVVLKYDCL